jgi:hypothetical protein
MLNALPYLCKCVCVLDISLQIDYLMNMLLILQIDYLMNMLLILMMIFGFYEIVGSVEGYVSLIYKDL